MGTLLLQAACQYWSNEFDDKLFHHVSTDEVYGSLHNPEEGIDKIVRWYLDNQQWMGRATSGEYEKYYIKMHQNR